MMNSGCGCNRRNGFFDGCEGLWIVVIIAIVIIWVHCCTGFNRGCGNNNCGCGNNSCDACMNGCGCM